MSETPFSAWTVFWLVWGAAMLLDIVAARIQNKRTFSEHVWGRWFSAPWKRVVFLLFWATVGVHFAFAGQGWFASGWAVMVTAAPVAVLIFWRERVMFGKVWGWIKKAAGGTYQFVLRKGPIISAAAVGLSAVFPKGAAVFNLVAGLLGGGSGAEQVDTGELSKAIAEFAGYLLLVIGAARKTWALTQPKAEPAK